MANPNNYNRYKDPYIKFIKLKNYLWVILAIDKVNAFNLLIYI
jgi:hypothetical protein